MVATRKVLVETHIKHRILSAYASLNKEQKALLSLGTGCMTEDREINEEIRFVPRNGGWIAYYEGTYGRWTGEKDRDGGKIKMRAISGSAREYEKNKHTV